MYQINKTFDVATDGVLTKTSLGIGTLGIISYISGDIIIDFPACPVDPFYIANHGILDDSIGIATMGWIVCDKPGGDPIISIPIGELLSEPTREWWYRKDDTDPWYGPLSYRDANSQARLMTLYPDNTIAEVKYAQVGTIFGSRGGDPRVDPHMIVVYIYANGRQYLGGRMATYNADKVPVS